jgi:hypothetical protein
MSDLAPKAARSGILISTPLDGGPPTTIVTVSCIHCAYTWLYRPGSGKRRGWCMKCHGILCGRPHCVAMGCVHREQLLENIEAGRPDNYQPIIASVPDHPPIQ